MYEMVTLKVWSLCFNLVCEADDEALLYRVRVQNPVNILSKGKCFWYTICCDCFIFWLLSNH